MSDYGDFCREMRDFKRDRRSQWEECPHCEVAFGTGRKVPPGQTCPNHPSWRAAGKPGDDLPYARQQERDRAAKPTRHKEPCPRCGRHYAGLKDHLRDKHGVSP